MSDVIEFGEVYKGSLNSDGRLSELVGETFLIKSVEITEIALGEVAIAEIERDGKTERRHTFSSVLIDQLKQVKEFTDKGKKVKATLKKVKRYYTLQ